MTFDLWKMPDISGLECVEENNDAAETMEVKTNVSREVFWIIVGLAEQRGGQKN